MDGPDKNNNVNKNDKSKDEHDDKKPAANEEHMMDYCSVCKVMYALDKYGKGFFAGCCIWMDCLTTTHQMGMTLGQCSKSKNWGPSWHMSHYCPKFNS
jgi:hypothetical protein